MIPEIGHGVHADARSAQPCPRSWACVPSQRRRRSRDRWGRRSAVRAEVGPRRVPVDELPEHVARQRLACGICCHSQPTVSRTVSSCAPSGFARTQSVVSTAISRCVAACSAAGVPARTISPVWKNWRRFMGSSSGNGCGPDGTLPRAVTPAPSRYMERERRPVSVRSAGRRACGTAPRWGWTMP